MAVLHVKCKMGQQRRALGLIVLFALLGSIPAHAQQSSTGDAPPLAAYQSSSNASLNFDSIRTLKSSSVRSSGWDKLVALLEQKQAAAVAVSSSSSSNKSPSNPIKTNKTGSISTKMTTTTSSSKKNSSSPLSVKSTSTNSKPNLSTGSSSDGTKGTVTATPSSSPALNSSVLPKSNSTSASKQSAGSGGSSSSSGSKPAGSAVKITASNGTATAALIPTNSNSSSTTVSNSKNNNEPGASSSAQSDVSTSTQPAANAPTSVTSTQVPSAPTAVSKMAPAAAPAAAPPAAAASTSAPPPAAATASAATPPPPAAAAAAAIPAATPPPPPALPAAAAPAAATPAEHQASGNTTFNMTQLSITPAANSTSNIRNSSAVAGSSATVATVDVATDGLAGMSLGGNATMNSTGNITADNITEAFANVCMPLGYKPPPRGRPAPPLAIQGATLVNKHTGKPIRIHGLNWFGFNVDMGMVDGLWAGGTDAATDFSKIAYQIRMLGFNAIRLPFAHKFLAKTDVWELQRDCAAVGVTKLKDRLIAPEDATRAVLRRNLPPNPALMRNAAGKCNSYLPRRSNQDRLLFVVQQFVALGFYVVLDYQPQGLEQEAYNLHQFVDKWKSVWKQVTCLPNFHSDIAGRVLIDVMNEPDSMGIRWEAQGDRPGAEQLYLATADALWSMSPNKMLFMFEGTGQNMFGLNWGNGFITDLDIIYSRGLSNPNSFFQQLVNKPYAKHTLISPHLYPPSITKSTWLGEELWKQSNTSFGYLQTRGYCKSQGQCRRFPVLVGETGSAYEAEDDKKWLEDFADFVHAKDGARKYNKIPLAGWMWWAYNENSGDTGGIVHNNWQDFHWGKLRYLMRSLGLRPWYKQQQGNNRRAPAPPTHRRPNRNHPTAPPSRPGPPTYAAPSPPGRNDRQNDRDRNSRPDRRNRQHRGDGWSSRRHRRDDRRPAEQLEQLFMSLTR